MSSSLYAFFLRVCVRACVCVGVSTGNEMTVREETREKSLI